MTADDALMIVFITAGAAFSITYLAAGIRRWHSHPPSAQPFRDWLRHGFSRRGPSFGESTGYHLLLDGVLCLLATAGLLLLYLW